VKPIFIATERFDPSDRLKWAKYVEWAKIPGLIEVVSLDCGLCPNLVDELMDADWKHNVQVHYRLGYFYDLDYLIERVAGVGRRNVLGLYRNPDRHIDTAPATGNFVFMGYDLIEEMTQISAVTNCGGFPETFSNDELNEFGLIRAFDRAHEIRRLLVEHNPEEPHARCEMYAIWRLAEG
jgi:hypothetical protein